MKHWIKISTVIFWYSVCIPSVNLVMAAESSSKTGSGGKLPLPSFSVSWLDDKTTYQAGDIATIKIKLFSGQNFNLSRYTMYFSLSVNGKKGNSSYISAVFPYVDGDPTYWNVSFTPIQVGRFSMVVMEDHSGIMDSSLHFTVTSGPVYPSACEVSWMNLVNEYVAGGKAYLLVLPKDAFGNNISSIEGPRQDYFMVSAAYENGSAAVVNDFRYNGWNQLAYIGFEFVPITSGNLLLHAYLNNQTLSGSPLPFLVKSGPLNITNSLAIWRYGTNSLQIFSELELFINQKDQHGNLVPGFYAFDARIVQKDTNLSIPVADLLFQEVAHGVQLLSFIVSEPGEFMLTIFSAKLNESLANMPYQYTVFTGYCHGLNSFVNGSGLAASVAGKMSYFTVYLEDLYHNPAPVEAEMLHIQVFSKNGTSEVRPVIFPLRSLNASAPVSTRRPTGAFSLLPANEKRTIIGQPTVLASDFKVSYTPTKSGEYEIWVFCGNIPLNSGRPYLMKVSPGTVDTSVSGVINFVRKVKRLMRNAVIVQLTDAFSNPVPSQRTKLSFQIEVSNSSSFLTWPFVDNQDGSYAGYYVSRDLGVYNICISFEDKHISNCPIEVQVYDRNYFPEAYNDSISVWEDESVVFDVLLNDYVPGGHATITGTSNPIHGSLLQYGKLFTYTPYKGYFGNDSFSYTFSDINENVATGTAFISVLCKPPQFVSLPVQLHATEDVISPKFGGFPGFELMYSNLTENVSLTIKAQSGTVFLAPMTMQFYWSFGSMLSVSRGGRAGKDLIIAGHVEIINIALQSIQYLGYT